MQMLKVFLLPLWSLLYKSRSAVKQARTPVMCHDDLVVSNLLFNVDLPHTRYQLLFKFDGALHRLPPN